MDASQPLFLYRLHLTEFYQDELNWNDETFAAVRAHAEFLDQLGQHGILAFAGRTQYGFDHPDLLGIAVIRAESMSAAQATVADDPAVAFGSHEGSLHPFSMAVQHLETFSRHTSESYDPVPGSAAPAEIVRRFFESMQARDWNGAEQCLAEDLRIEFSATGEVFDGSAFLAMNRAYPEGWRIEILETIACDERVAAQVIVDHGKDRFRCSGFYVVSDDQISSGVENWVTEGADEAPGWRAPFRS